MTITYQNHENHCGICVINSLVQHYFKQNNFNQLLSDANIVSNGLSIYDFESLCLKYGIIAESYETNCQELEQLQTKDYFVLMIERNNDNHYVIAKKASNGVKIFDSANGEYILSYEQLAKVFCNIFIKISKAKLTKEINLNQKQWINSLNVKYILLVVLMQILIAGLSISFGLFINYVLDLCVISGNIKNLLIISFSFAVISLLKYFFNYLLTLYNSRYLKEEYYFYKDKVFKHLFNKKSNFFQKIYKSNFFMLNTAIITMCQFNLTVVPNLIANCLIVIVCLVILIINNPLFLVPVICMVIFQIFYSIIDINIQKKNLERNILNTSKINIYSNKYVQNNNGYNNCFVIDKLTNNLNNEFNVNLKNNLFQSIKSSKLSCIYNFFQDAIYILTVFIGIIMIWKNDNLSIGQILFIINTHLILSNSIMEIAHFFSQRLVYKKMYNIFSEFCEVDNIVNKSKIVIDNIFSIKQINKGNTTEFTNGKSCKRDSILPFTNQLLNRCQIDKSVIKINDIDSNKISQKWLIENVCYLSDEINFLIKELDYNHIRSNQLIIESIRQFNISFEKPKNKNEVMVLNLISLLNVKNKIIILDKCLVNFNKREKKFIKEKIIFELTKNNFLILNE